MLSRLVITFLPRSKCLLISRLQSPSAVILEIQKINSLTVSIVSPSICHEVMGPDAMILVFWMLSFKPTLSLSSLTFIRRLFSSSSLSALRVVSSASLRLLKFLLHVQWLRIHLQVQGSRRQGSIPSFWRSPGERMVTQPSVRPEIPWTEQQSMGSQRVRYNKVTTHTRQIHTDHTLLIHSSINGH